MGGTICCRRRHRCSSRPSPCWGSGRSTCPATRSRSARAPLTTTPSCSSCSGTAPTRSDPLAPPRDAVGGGGPPLHEVLVHGRAARDQQTTARHERCQRYVSLEQGDGAEPTRV